jgi:RNA polymerase sigma-70 factor, ECF subfamily
MTYHEFNKMIPRYRGEMFRYAVFLTANRDDALDLVQSTYLKAIKHRESFEGDNIECEGDKLRAWLFTILKNTFINNYRANKSHANFISSLPDLQALIIGSDKGDRPDSRYAHSELKEIISQIRLPYRKPFQMLIDGYKYEEIASALDINIGTVKSRIFLARKMIMDILKNDHKVNLKPLEMTKETNGPCATEPINDIAKKCIADRTLKSIADEKLGNKNAAFLLGLKSPVYLSMIGKPDLWSHCGSTVWIQLQKWANSGVSITKYGSTFGRLLSNIEKVKEKSPKLAHPMAKSEEKIKTKPTSTPEAMAAIYDIMKDHTSAKTGLLIVFPTKSIELDGMTIEQAIEEVKNTGGKYYFGEHGKATIFEIRKLYEIEVKPVETRF